MSPLCRRALGEAFLTLPSALRRFHGGPGHWHGTAHLTQGSRAARFAARRAGYPEADGALPLTLMICKRYGVPLRGEA